MLGSAGKPGVTVVVFYVVKTELEGMRKNLLELIMSSRLSCHVQEIKLLLHGMYTYVYYSCHKWGTMGNRAHWGLNECHIHYAWRGGCVAYEIGSTKAKVPVMRREKFPWVTPQLTLQTIVMPTSQHICTYTSHGCAAKKHTINKRGVLLQWKQAGVQEYRDHHMCDKHPKYMASPPSPGAASTTNQSTKCSESGMRLQTPQVTTYQFPLVTTKRTLVLRKRCPQDSSIRTISGCQ